MTLLAGRSITKSFGSRLILDGADLAIEPGARIGVVGPNGSGTSTLLKILAGLETADGGKVSRTRGTGVAYLDQHPQGDERTPLQTVLAARPDLVERELVDLAAQLGSDVMLARPTLLVLDEPTNHLDIVSVEVLEAAIEEFAGTTVVAISHDRYFLDRVVDRIVEVDGRVRATDGGYSAWLERRSAGAR